jgi:hypothetical protein
MNLSELSKSHRKLAALYIESKKKMKYGGNPVPKKDKNYIISIVNDQRRCFSVIEYNDGWEADSNNGKVHDRSVPCIEMISYHSEQENNISESEFISLLMEIIEIYSTFDLNNNVIICSRTNGAGRIVFDAIRNEVREMIDPENVRFFPLSRRLKTGVEQFKNPGKGWEMTAADEKNCLNAMKTAEGEGFFTLVTDRSRSMFQLATSIDSKEQQDIESFQYVWMMLSFIRLYSMSLFPD